MNHTPHLGTLDIVVLIGYVTALASIGWWAARKTARNTEDYFLASRSIPWLVTTASFLATIISAMTFVGTPAEGYSSDFKYLFSNVGDIAATFFVAGLFLPVYQKLRVTSIYEFIEHRFGRPVRTASAGYFLISRTLASTIRIVGISKVLEVVTGGALSFAVCVILTVVVILAYTIMGGGRAIAWTDLMQFTLLVGGALLALGFIVQQVPGGFGGIIEAGKHAIGKNGLEYNKFNFLDGFSGENLWMVLFMATWGFFQSTAAYGCDQDMVQRLLACNDTRKARWSLMISGLAGIPITGMFLFIGVGLYAYSRVHPELIAGMADNDHIFPRFILTVMPEGLRGLLLAAVASAAMGSADSALASLATAFTLDFYRPFFGKDASEARTVAVSKLSYVGFGVLFIIFALLFRRLDNLLWLSFRVVPFTYGPLLGVFLVGILTDWKIGANRMLGLMFGLTATLSLLAFIANAAVAAGQTAGFWFMVNEKYWRMFVVLGALGVPFGAFFLRTRGQRFE